MLKRRYILHPDGGSADSTDRMEVVAVGDDFHLEVFGNVYTDESGADSIYLRLSNTDLRELVAVANVLLGTFSPEDAALANGGQPG